MDISKLRQDYSKESLSESDLNPDPMKQFKKWFDQASKAELLEPNAMVLATTDKENQAFTRTVLLKRLDDDGFVFFTNYESRKAEHLKTSNKVSLLFLWLALERQVSINGTVEKISSAESLAYFASRPFKSKLGAWASKQSSVITSRSIIEGKWNEMKQKFSKGEVPLPSFWGGYKVIPNSIEFWQGRKSRLHDRFIYEKEGSNWKVNRLSP